MKKSINTIYHFINIYKGTNLYNVNYLPYHDHEV